MKPPKRKSSQERGPQEPTNIEGYDVWQAGEDYMTQRRQVLKVLSQAQKELTEKYALSEEMKRLVAKVLESHSDSDAKEKLTQFTINLETAERINQIKLEMARTNQEENDRQKGVIRKPEYLEPKDTPGASNSTDRPKSLQ